MRLLKLNRSGMKVAESFKLALADGSLWQIQGDDEKGSEIASMLSDVMKMNLYTFDEPCTRLSITTDFRKGASGEDGWVEAFVTPMGLNGVSLADVLAGATHKICLDVQSRKGLLIHGALVEREGLGAILTGPSGVGKTTASNRIQPPWRSLSDDLTLVICDRQCRYWAHPWPTWSQFDKGGPGGSWNVPYAVPLMALFFLCQAETDNVELPGPGQAACMLLETTEQAHYRLSWLDNDPSSHRLQRFENACLMVKAVPCFILHLSLTGEFWEQMDAVMGMSSRT
jgi:hypothetical protein